MRDAGNPSACADRINIRANWMEIIGYYIQCCQILAYIARFCSQNLLLFKRKKKLVWYNLINVIVIEIGYSSMMSMLSFYLHLKQELHAS